MVRRKSRINTVEEAENKKKKLYPVGEMIFKSRQDYTYFLKLEKLLEEGLIESFEPDSLLVARREIDPEFENETEWTVENVELVEEKITKYNAKKIVINGEKLDSRLEADYYLHLLQLKKDGEVVDFQLKPVFELQPSFQKNGKKIGAIKYIADFSVDYPDGRNEIVDTKGVITADFALKKKIFEYTFPEHHLRIVKYVASMGGWIEVDEWARIKKQRAKK